MAETTIPDHLRGLTFEDVWAALMEDREQMKKKSEQWEKESEQWKEQLRVESEQRKKESEQRKKKWDEEMEALARRFKETDRISRRVSKQMGGLHNRFGELAEHLVAPGILKRFNDLGYHFEGVSRDLQIVDEGGRAKSEIDILLENGEYIMAVEVKTRPAEKDIERHAKRLEILREHRDKLNDKRKIRGAIAGAVFPAEVKEAARAAGFYVLEQSGDTMKMDIPPGFTPADW